MEEWVGQKWHHWVVRHSESGYEDSAILLKDIRSALKSLLVSLGGASNLSIQTAWPVRFPHVQHTKVRLAGKERHSLAWLSDESLYLPEQVNVFPNGQQNLDLYYWWVALAACWPEENTDWYANNALAMERVFERLPGLKRRWPKLQKHLLAMRPSLTNMRVPEQSHELHIRGVLAQANLPETALPITQKFPYPIHLWLYPPQNGDEQSRKMNDENDLEQEGDNENTENRNIEGKKSAKRVTESDDKNGLLLFRLENLFTVTDWLNIQRPDEDDDDSSNEAAHDLDHISLSQNQSTKGAKVRFDLDLPSQAVDDLPLNGGTLFHEWHYKRESFLEDHCRVVPLLSRDAVAQDVPEKLKPLVRKVRAQFKQWRSEPIRLKRQLDGNEVDVQAWLDFTTQPTHDSAWPVYIDRPRIHKSRSTLLLADISQSTESYVNNRPIIDGIRDALMVFSEGLDAISEPFSLYAFSSIRRRDVRFHMIKNAKEAWSDITRGRVMALKPGYYTRMGAAIRQSTEVLQDQEQQQKWLLILTDGKPNDVDHYEHRYGIEDTRKAVLEAKEKGIQVFAITLDPEADEYAPHLFGAENYHLVTKNENIVDVLPRLFRQLSGD